jgi:hypothetical protein
VPPLRTIQTDASNYNTWPSVMTTDSAGEVIAVVQRQQGNAIEVFQGGPTGSSTPTREITGPTTGLGTCRGYSNCDEVAIAFSEGQIYALVSAKTGVHLSVFSGSASGDAPPLRTIVGQHTGFAGQVGTGIAVGAHRGPIYVLVKTAQFQGRGTVEVFTHDARGDAAPIRTFTDGQSHLANGQGIAIG